MKVLIGCFDEESLPLHEDVLGSGVFAEAKAANLRFGRNGLLLTSDSLLIEAIHTRHGRLEPTQPLAFEPGQLSPVQRERRKSFGAAMSLLAPSQWHAGMVPVIYGLGHDERVDLYHEAETTVSDVLALRFASIPGLPLPVSHRQCLAMLLDEAEALNSRAALFGTRWNYSQWCSDMELERKYTYRPIPDIWRLAVGLHKELYRGDYPCFFPEPHWGFQVFDYENHIFDVTEPREETGISPSSHKSTVWSQSSANGFRKTASFAARAFGRTNHCRLPAS